jgi:hypothetical protein
MKWFCVTLEVRSILAFEHKHERHSHTWSMSQPLDTRVCHLIYMTKAVRVTSLIFALSIAAPSVIVACISVSTTVFTLRLFVS